MIQDQYVVAGTEQEASPLRVAIVHDYLTQRGGAERVVLAMERTFPGSPIYTGLYEPDSTFPEFRGLDVRPSKLQHIRFLRRHHLAALPLMPSAIRSLQIEDADIVLASSSGWSHGVRTDMPVITYCHNPPRWLYQTNEYAIDLSSSRRAALSLLTPMLRAWDQRSARRSEQYLTNSRTVRERIRDVYGIDASLLPPPIGIEPTVVPEPLQGIRPGFFLSVSRARGYKNIDVLVEAMRQLPTERLVILNGPAAGDLPENVSCLPRVSDSELKWLYTNADALLTVAYEDFGLTPLEANSCGTPCVALRAGGFLDTVDEGVSGVYATEPTPDAVVEAIEQLRHRSWDENLIRTHADHYSERAFSERLREVVYSCDRRSRDAFRAGSQ